MHRRVRKSTKKAVVASISSLTKIAEQVGRFSKIEFNGVTSSLGKRVSPIATACAAPSRAPLDSRHR
jgi:hypothetical protein